jgi:ribosomal protein S27AE
MRFETKTCQNCKAQFTIESEDFEFYERMKVAVPELCTQCGVEQVMALRNERHLYRGKCIKCSKTTLSMYSSDSSYAVYCHDC